MPSTKQKYLKKLRALGLPPDYAEAAYRYYGTQVEETIRENPYRLLFDLYNIDWLTIDTIAEKLGWRADHPHRLEGTLYAELLQDVTDGHTWIPRERLIRSAVQRAGQRGQTEYDETSIDFSEMEDSLEEIIAQNHCIAHEFVPRSSGQLVQAIQIPSLYYAEKTIAESIRGLLNTASPFAAQELDEAEMHMVERDLHLTLAEDQRRAIRESLHNKVMIITGGPGTGKTTILRGVIRLWERHEARIRLAAPTGRAAKRLAESTRRSAKTIHRLLEYQPDTHSFARGFSRKLKADLLIVDEASMIDTELMAALLEAIPRHAHLILVGDVNQLPSVGPGTILDDFIAGGCIPTVRLTEIYRQSEGSLISLNARYVNEGKEPILDAGGIEMGQDFFMIEKRSYSDVVNTTIELVTNRIPNQFQLSPLTDVQVLVPMHKGEVGVENLNTRLQALLRGWNCDARRGDRAERIEAIHHQGRSFSVGDKVMQTKNDYDRDVFNGDLGIVTGVNIATSSLTVSIDGREVIYEEEDLYNLALAYATTIHKAQGSEYPAVVVPLVIGHRRMLQRNLLYTAISRGKRLVVIVGHSEAVRAAIDNDRVVHRRTYLAERIQPSKQ